MPTIKMLERIMADYQSALAPDRDETQDISETTLATLERADANEFADADAFAAHLEALGLADRAVTPDLVALAAKGALWRDPSLGRGFSQGPSTPA